MRNTESSVFSISDCIAIVVLMHDSHYSTLHAGVKATYNSELGVTSLLRPSFTWKKNHYCSLKPSTNRIKIFICFWAFVLENHDFHTGVFTPAPPTNPHKQTKLPFPAFIHKTALICQHPFQYHHHIMSPSLRWISRHDFHEFQFDVSDTDTCFMSSLNPLRYP